MSRISVSRWRFWIKKTKGRTAANIALDVSDNIFGYETIEI